MLGFTEIRFGISGGNFADSVASVMRITLTITCSVLFFQLLFHAFFFQDEAMGYIYLESMGHI